MKRSIKSLIDKYLVKQGRKRSKSFYDNAIQYNPSLKESVKGENEWLEKWRKFDPKLSPMAYRVFSRYIGPSMDIVPLEVCSSICEPVLTPRNFMDYYSDKNSFDLLFPKGTLPQTFLRNIRGRFFNRDYAPIETTKVNEYLNCIDCKELIVKPTLSSSGKGVEKFFRDGSTYVNKKKEILSLEYLNKNYKNDCIIQEVFIQHSFFSQFNETSVNSIRIVTYRDSRGIIHALNSFLRIGAKGSVVDNAHAGGVFVGIDKKGCLGKYVCDQYGQKHTVFNGIDFSTGSFVIPHWNLICDKVEELSMYVIHHDLIAWDAILNAEGNPQILEVNVGGYGGWAFQFTSGPMFGDYTDDVMEYVTQKKEDSELKMSFYRK